MPRTKTHKVFTEQLKSVHPDIKCLTTYTGCDDVIVAKHVCGHTWNARPANLLKGHGCPECRHGSSNKTTSKFKQELKAVNREILLLEEYVNAKTKVSVKHTCGHVWSTLPNVLLKGHGCPACSHKLKWAQEAKTFVRGYEPQALKWLTKTRFKAKQIQVSDIPWITYSYSGRKRKYYPDFFVADEALIIEVKSMSSMGLSSNFYKLSSRELLATLKAKRRACIKQGFNFELMLMAPDGARIALPDNWYQLSGKAIRKAIV
jgi:predicted  nucleic acid-binding Zn-ribbon protein